jgi:hypothetical protein
MGKESRPPQTPFKKARRNVTSPFEERMLSQLDSQDRILERLEQKLNAPVLNGGFEDLTAKVTKIESVQETMRETQKGTSSQVADIHALIYDPEKGMYVTVKDHGRWITKSNKIYTWTLALFVTGTLTGIGKFLYDIVTGHIAFKP